MVVSGVDGMQTRSVEECLHEGDCLGARIGVALLRERDVGVEAGVIGTGYFGVGLGLEVGECEGGYVDECERWKNPVLALLRDQRGSNGDYGEISGHSEDGTRREMRLGVSESRRGGATDLQVSLSGTVPGDGVIRDIIIDIVHISWKALVR